MKVTQLTVFLENRSGRLAEIADILGREGINIRGFSTTEAAEYGIVRLIVTEPGTGAGATPRRRLHHALQRRASVSRCRTCRAASPRCWTSWPPPGVSIDYLYSISFWNICFAVRDVDRAIELLEDKVTLLTDEEVRAL